MDWSRVADWSATAITILTLGARQQYLKGKHSQRFEAMDKQLADHENRLKGHTAQLADGVGNFKVIDAKLDNIIKGQDEQKRSYDTTQALLIEHLTNGDKS